MKNTYELKLFLLCFMLVLGTGMELYAQDPSQNRQEIRFGIGVSGPVGRSVGGDASEIFSLTYAHYGLNGIGYRFGAELMPNNLDFATSFGFPIAFSLRTRDRSFSESVITGVESAAAGAVRDGIYGYEPTAGSILGDFLLGLLNRTEFFAGLTPGYIAGPSASVIEESYSGPMTTLKTMTLENRFSITADAGFSMSFRIWRFNLGVVPSIHYFLTKNYVCVTSTGSTDSEEDRMVSKTPVRFQFSVMGALGFSF